MQLIGQKENLEIIQKWNKFPNFLIIQGEEHTGKKYFLLYLCKLFNLHYKLVGNSVKEVRELVNVMEPNSNTVYHFDNFDGASIQAKNALLKVTEETPAGNYIAITGGPQIPTLQSRARRIIISPYTFDDLKDLYSEFTIKDVRRLYDVGIDTPAKIEIFKTFEDIENLLDMTYTIFEKITYLNCNDYIPVIKYFETRPEPGHFDKCELFLTMLTRLIESSINIKQKYSYNDILFYILDVKSKLHKEYTLNRRFLLFTLFYDIEQLQFQGNNLI